MRDVALKIVPKDIKLAKKLIKGVIRIKKDYENSIEKIKRKDGTVHSHERALPEPFDYVKLEDWKNAFILINTFSDEKFKTISRNYVIHGYFTTQENSFMQMRME